MKTIFERIIAGEIKAEQVFENEHVIVIKDIAPKAPLHLLIITKKVIPTLQAMQEEEMPLLAEVVKAAQKMAQQFGVEKSGYRLLVNNGPHAGQEIYHLHFHLLAGGPLGDMG